MAEESLQIPNNQNLDYHIITLFQRLESMRKDGNIHRIGAKMSMKNKYNMQVEIRTLEFWRSIIAECLASFLYVFIVCGAAAGAGVGASVSSVLLATALSSGFVVTILTQCFSHISGAHINPAVSFGMAVIGAISPLRAIMYITAHCGGAIAGAALLYGVTVPGYQGNLQAAIVHTSTLAAWERFGVEMILTFVVVLTYFMSSDSYKSYFGVSSLTIGAAYSACSFVSMPYLNPARSLGPSFVLNKWDNHWVYWIGPLAGGAFSGLMYQYVFSPRRAFKLNKDSDNDSNSMNSDDDTNFDIDLEKSQMNQPKFHGSTYRSPTGTLVQQNGYCQNLYTSGIASKFDPSEPLYGGTRSMYCRSPPLSRANLNRSQSVYAKSNTAINRDATLPRPGPLVPAQSLYPMRLNQNQSSHLQNQNVQNQLQQRSESIYGIRSSIRHERTQIDNMQAGFQPVYGARNDPTLSDGLCKYERETHRELRDEAKMFVNRNCRPDSMYGVTQRRGQSAQSDDSSYGSYHGPTPPSSSTPLTTAQNRPPGCEMMMNGNYATQPPPPPSTTQQMRPPNQGERKLSSNGSNERQAYAGQTQPKPPPHNGNGAANVGSAAPITHQYSMQPIRQN